MKLGRNEKCHCGSGLKYKKCCQTKSSETKKTIEITLSNLINTIKLGLENLDKINGSKQKIRVKDIKLMNEDSLVCEFYPYKKKSIDIKIEIATIMGFFNGFFKDDPYDGIRFRYYATRAYNNEDLELLYALSSKASAEQLGTGNSVDWMKSTIFQENTNDYRLGIAKKIISEIEITIRKVIKDILSKKYGTDWWNLTLNNKLGKSIKDTYNNQFGFEIDNGNVLIKYTYILQLKKIITTYWPDFKMLFNKKTDFENLIDSLNLIRREEAHNRVITQSHLDELNEIYIKLLSKISEKYPEILPTHLIDSWKSKIKLIMSNVYKPLYSNSELIDEPDSKIKLIKSINSTKHLIEYIKETIIRLQSLVVPVQKNAIHNELVQHFDNYKNLSEKKLKNITNGELQILLKTLKEIENYEITMNEFTGKFLLSEA
ncbi:SEC-C domain-containing protein [Polaribacter porphyrae]|uniref:Uncharacterized protein n=1 Tax=Polaribacter porphyrae TaxID=1137780 RepID=A0A2S7WLF5_9FLAO|nr:SEC-C domain-containing protein [Polaribacter porphyrae]PQJ78403.1 hypothetical protein BTO18_03995 [Polaribacter porphyrae]